MCGLDLLKTIKNSNRRINLKFVIAQCLQPRFASMALRFNEDQVGEVVVKVKFNFF